MERGGGGGGGYSFINTGVGPMIESFAPISLYQCAPMSMCSEVSAERASQISWVVCYNLFVSQLCPALHLQCHLRAVLVTLKEVAS